MKNLLPLFLCTLAAPLTTFGCGDDSMVMVIDEFDAAPGIDAAAAGPTAFVVAGDFLSGTGIASTIDMSTLEVTANAVAGVVSDDPVLRYSDGTLYIINRFGHDNITLVDAASLALVRQVQTGANSNPQDVVAKDGTLYVAALGAPGILAIDAQGDITTIDLSSLDAVDGMPDCGSIYLVGDTLVAVCGALDGFVATVPGKVALIDTTDNSVINSFDLSTVNPVGLLMKTPDNSTLGGDLLIATVDFNSGLTVGCIERIALTPVAESRGCLLDNVDLGGYATGLMYKEDFLYIGVTTGFDVDGSVAHAIRYNAAAAQLEPAPLTAPEERVFDLAVCPNGQWLAADAAGGVRVYDADDTQLTTGVLDIGLPPTDNGVVCY